MADYLLVMTAAGDRETASLLASSAVKARLAASAQVQGPVSSFFWHLGEAGEGEEWQVTFKTRRSSLRRAGTAFDRYTCVGQTRGYGYTSGRRFRSLPPLVGRQHRPIR